MKKNPASQSGLFNPRILVAPLSGALCSVGALLVMFSFADAARASDPGQSSSSWANIPESFATGQGTGLVLGFDQGSNVWFAHAVWANSPAERAGIPVGARVLSIGGIALPVGAIANEPSALTEIQSRLGAAALQGSIAVGWQESGGVLHNDQIRFEPLPDLYLGATANGGPAPTQCFVCVLCNFFFGGSVCTLTSGYGFLVCGGSFICNPVRNLCVTAGPCIPIGINPPPLSRVASEMTHGTGPSAPSFDIDLPQTGPRGVECRSGVGGVNGNYTLVFTFVNTVVSCGMANTSGGSVSNSPSVPNGNQCTVNLTGVPNAQYVTVTLTGVADSAHNEGDVSATMGVLLGDVNGDGRVNVGDTNQTKSLSGATLDQSSGTFKSDVNLDGRINVGDTNFVKAHSGSSLP